MSPEGHNEDSKIQNTEAALAPPVNDLKNAVPCVANCMLFDPSDEVMKNNVVYNQYHRDKYELGDKDFLPRSDAVRFFNQTTMQLQMLELSPDNA
ncbi:cartilage-associated protein-like [Oncorhynchus kisutch]|uniref:cartilage-associated protein-like n=1 Tax=Oncorhynchus kisutch TaxID=8019 RepID=UPI0012DC7B02|nr:cartilage-associated protein-like [Oncorhynchus kisutch]